MKTYYILVGVLLGLSVPGYGSLESPAIDPATDPVGSLLETNTLAVSVLEKKNIYVAVNGTVEVDFPTALRALQIDDLLGRIEDAWVATQKEDIYFEINQEDAVTYSYIDRKGHPTKIVEIGRFFTTREDGKTQLDLIFFSEGERFFGKFEALSRMSAWPADSDGVTAYTSSVYAYPKNGFSRFFARHLGLVDRFFRKETKLIETYAADISRHIVSTFEATPAVQPARASAPMP